MDFAAVAAGLQQAVPFNAHIGLEVAEVAPGRGVVRLPEHDHLLNHVGSQHAGALFALGEAASGAALVGAFADRLAELAPLAERAEIAYRRPARGPITATARLEQDERWRGELDDSGVTRFPVEVDLADREGAVVATMTVHWHVKKSG